MANIGKITKRNVNGQEVLEGYVSTLQLKLSFELQKNTMGMSENAPDYLITVFDNDGEETIVGAAWIKTMHRHMSEPKDFISMSFDDPSFTTSLNVAAFQKDENNWDIVWRRRQISQNTN